MFHMKRLKRKRGDSESGSASAPETSDRMDMSVLGEPEAAYVVEKVRHGLGFEEFHALREMLGLTEEKLGALLGMSRATLHRRKKSGQLDPSESDRLVRYARILNFATDVFGSREKASGWLSRPALAFNGETPLSYADTETGSREVEGLIGRIEHGVFS